MISQQQQNRIADYCREAGVVYYDIEQALQGHMMEWLEQDQLVNGHSFEEAFQLMKQVFTVSTCHAMMHSGSKAVQARAARNWMRAFLSYFTWPRIGMAFFLLVLAWVAGFYIQVKEFPSLAINVLSILHISVAFGRGQIVYRNRQERAVKLTGFRYLLRIQYCFLSIPVVYGIVSVLATMGVSFPVALYEVLLCLFPFVFLVCLAWRHTYIAAHEKIRQDYPGGFIAA